MSYTTSVVLIVSHHRTPEKTLAAVNRYFVEPKLTGPIDPHEPHHRIILPGLSLVEPASITESLASGAFNYLDEDEFIVYLRKWVDWRSLDVAWVQIGMQGEHNAGFQFVDVWRMSPTGVDQSRRCPDCGKHGLRKVRE